MLFKAVPGFLLILLLLGGCATNEVAELEYLANRGDAESRYRLGEMAVTTGIDNGRLDYNKGLEYLKLSNTPQARLLLRELWLTGVYPDSGEACPELRDTDIAAVKMAWESERDPESGYLLGCIEFESGRRENALELWEETKNRFYYPASIKLAELGLAEAKDQHEANPHILALRRASRWGYIYADYLLYSYYAETDQKTAQHYLSLAAERGEAHALLERGKINDDISEIAKAAAAGLREAQYELAKRLPNDDLTREDWLRKAVNRGDKNAAKLLAESLAERGRYGESLLLKITLTENPVERLFSEPSAVPAYSLEERALWLPACYVYPAGIDCSEALRLNRGAIFEGGEEFYRAGFNPAGSYCNLDWYWLLKERRTSSWQEIFWNGIAEYSSEPGYWLSYALAASLAGQGESAVYGAWKLRSFDDAVLQDLALLVEVNGLLLLGMDDAAWNKFGNYKFQTPGLPENILDLITVFMPELLIKAPEDYRALLPSSALAVEIEPQTFYDAALGRAVDTENVIYTAPVTPVEPPPPPLVLE